VINGKSVTKTLDEWLEAASKVEEADGYLLQAQNHLTQTRTKVTKEQIEAEQRQSDEDDVALVKAIQTGTQEEAVRLCAPFAPDRNQCPQEHRNHHCQGSSTSD